jgi:hypothetical protein
MLDLVRRRYLWLGISVATIIPGLIALMIWGLNLGIFISPASPSRSPAWKTG